MEHEYVELFFASDNKQYEQTRNKISDINWKGEIDFLSLVVWEDDARVRDEKYLKKIKYWI